MNFKVLTIFPDYIENALSESILGRARRAGIIGAEAVDIRPFSACKHKNTDDTPYGGGAGMVMLAQPIADAMKAACGEGFRGKRIYLSPKGRTFTQRKAEELSKEENLVLLCGHYEGVDQRAIDAYIDEEISVGDYVLTGGELGALIVIDAVARLLPGVLGCDESSVDESFSSGLLEYPQYTRPRVFEGVGVPELLFDGDQKRIDRWRRDEALRITYRRRPELLRGVPLDGADHALLRSIDDRRTVRVCIGTENAEELKARLSETADAKLVFVSDPAEADALILEHAPSEELLSSGKRIACGDRGGQWFETVPARYSRAVRELTGDTGIARVELCGVSEAEFLASAEAILPVRKLRQPANSDVLLADFGKNRAAAHIKNAARRVCRVTWQDGARAEWQIPLLPQGYIDALAEFICRQAPSYQFS